MSVNAGENAELVDSQKVTLSNATDLLDFGQLYNIEWDGVIVGFEKVRTDGSRDEIDGTTRRSIRADIWLTQPEISTFIGYNTPTGTPPQLPTNDWDTKWTAFDLSTDTRRITGKVRELHFIARETDGAWYNILITSTTGGVA